MTRHLWMLLLPALAAPGVATATLYKCVGANGRASFQQKACPPASTSTVLDKKQEQGAAVAPESITGHWRIDSTDPNDGKRMLIDFSINADASFSGSADITGEEPISYSGTWQINGHKLIWTYLETKPRTPVPRVDVDVIEEADGDLLRLRSVKNGNVTEYQRVKPRK